MPNIRLALALALLLMPAACLSAPELPHRTSWMGNSFGGADNWKHVPNVVWGFAVLPGGGAVTNSFWDEDGWEAVRFTQDGDIAAHGVNTHATGGHAAATDGHYWFVSGHTDGGTNGDYYGVRRLTLDGQDAPYADGSAFRGIGYTKLWNGTPNWIETPGGPQAQEVQGLTRAGGLVFAADAKANHVSVWNIGDGAARPGFDFARPRQIAAAPDGTLWLSQAPDLALPAAQQRWRVRHLTAQGKSAGPAVTLPAGTVTGGVCVDARPGQMPRLFVCDNGPDSNVKIYTHLGTAPVLSGTWGERGGPFSAGTSRGAYGPLRFLDLAGIGMDSAGCRYVAMGRESSLPGPDIRKFTPDGKTLLWRRTCLSFVTGASFDPATDGADVFTKGHLFHLDLGQTAPGTEEKTDAVTLDAARYPQDPRRVLGLECAIVRRVAGRRFLYLTDMYRSQVAVFRFDAKSPNIAIPCALLARQDSGDPNKKAITAQDKTGAAWPPFQPTGVGWIWTDTNGDGKFDASEFQSLPRGYEYRGSYEIAPNGDIWQAARTHLDALYQYKLTSVLPNGVPQFQVQTPLPPPAPFTDPLHVTQDADGALWLSGFSVARPAQGDPAGEFGSLLISYPGWQKNDWTPGVQILLPYDASANPKQQMEAGDAAGDFWFVVGGFDGIVHVYDRKSGAVVGTLSPGPEVGGHTGWIDIPVGLQAMQRKNGEYLVLVEEDWLGKIMLYRWNGNTK